MDATQIILIVFIVLLISVLLCFLVLYSMSESAIYFALERNMPRSFGVKMLLL